MKRWGWAPNEWIRPPTSGEDNAVAALIERWRIPSTMDGATTKAREGGAGDLSLTCARRLRKALSVVAGEKWSACGAIPGPEGPTYAECNEGDTAAMRQVNQALARAWGNVYTSWSTVVGRLSVTGAQVVKLLSKWEASLSVGFILRSNGPSIFAFGQKAMLRAMKGISDNTLIILLVLLPGVASMPLRSRESLTKAGYALGSRGGNQPPPL